MSNIGKLFVEKIIEAKEELNKIPGVRLSIYRNGFVDLEFPADRVLDINRIFKKYGLAVVKSDSPDGSYIFDFSTMNN